MVLYTGTALIMVTSTDTLEGSRTGNFTATEYTRDVAGGWKENLRTVVSPARQKTGGMGASKEIVTLKE